MTVSPPPAAAPGRDDLALATWNSVEASKRPLPSKARELLVEDRVYGRRPESSVDEADAGLSLFPVFQLGNLLTAFKLIDRDNDGLVDAGDVALLFQSRGVLLDPDQASARAGTGVRSWPTSKAPSFPSRSLSTRFG